MLEKIVPCKSEEKIKEDLLKLVTLAKKELQATDAVIIPASKVVVDERVKMKCAVPRCFNYGSCANCPPYTPDVETVRNTISKYSYAIVVKRNVTPVEHFADRTSSLTNAKVHEREFAQIIAKLENAAFSAGYYLALGLAGGSCRNYLCNDKVCQYLDSGRCRYIRIARPSVEAYGIDAFQLAVEAGWDIYPIGPQHVSPKEVPLALNVGIVFIT
ncbi:DUF2284 domain-containing protein [Calderihabitans maritimus]|uniref:DUF2284 domain-containing protein n=1 Tax=Calderihabitans maritimus TaxID=1246530 RepID=A0A1Z5HW82_9FIRM|nr:DUF2284 domain-containing protein [Calderihabitans maritimus]GAW93796.1 hypothetical protein Ferp_2206 [Calderihabitans maritimus]